MKSQRCAKNHTAARKKCFSQRVIAPLLILPLSIAYADLSVTNTSITDASPSGTPPSGTSVNGSRRHQANPPEQSTSARDKTPVTSEVIQALEKLYKAKLVSLSASTNGKHLARLITDRGEVLLIEISPNGDIVKMLE